MCRTKTKIKQNTYNNALTALFWDERGKQKSSTIITKTKKTKNIKINF